MGSLLATGFFSMGHLDERLVIAKKARQGGMAEWGRRRKEKNLFVRVSPMSLTQKSLLIIPAEISREKHTSSSLTLGIIFKTS